MEDRKIKFRVTSEGRSKISHASINFERFISGPIHQHAKYAQVGFNVR